MRKTLVCASMLLLTALVGCVTINVYFPEAAAQKAADQFIGSVIDQSVSPSQSDDAAKHDDKQGDDGGPSASLLNLLIPAAYAGNTPDLRIHTPTIDAIQSRMRKRFRDSLSSLLDEGAIGFSKDGLVQVRKLSAAPMAQRALVNSVVAAENRDRNQLYAEIAKANGHPQWQAQVRETFARLWISRAHKGWYYHDGAGGWKRK